MLPKRSLSRQSRDRAGPKRTPGTKPHFLTRGRFRRRSHEELASAPNQPATQHRGRQEGCRGIGSPLRIVRDGPSRIAAAERHVQSHTVLPSRRGRARDWMATCGERYRDCRVLSADNPRRKRGDDGSDARETDAKSLRHHVPRCIMPVLLPDVVGFPTHPRQPAHANLRGSPLVARYDMVGIAFVA